MEVIKVVLLGYCVVQDNSFCENLNSIETRGYISLCVCLFGNVQ